MATKAESPKAAPPSVAPPKPAVVKSPVDTSVAIKAAIAELQDAERKDGVTSARFKAAQKALSDLQQGLPVVDMTANSFAKSKNPKLADELWRKRMELRARTDPDIAKLLTQK